jgi:hypothetical protein
VEGAIEEDKPDFGHEINIKSKVLYTLFRVILKKSVGSVLN